MAAVLLAASGCGRAETETDGRIHVCVSVLPQQYFVERIGGDRVDVTVMVGPGDNHERYEPRPSQVRDLSRASLFFTIGLPFEAAWMERFRAAKPDLRVVPIEGGWQRLPVPAGHHHGHDNDDPEHVCSEDGLDPHLWVSPRVMKLQVGTICRALSEAAPEHAAYFASNAAAFEADMEALDQELAQRLEPFAGRAFMVMHPAWGYFARDYGLRMLPMEVGGQEPSPAELAGLVEQARREGIRDVFAQPEFNARPAEILARELGGEVIMVTPLAEAWSSNLVHMASALVRSFEAAPGEAKDAAR